MEVCMKRRSKNAAMIGGAVALSLMMAAPVYAGTEKTTENTEADRSLAGEQAAADVTVMDTEAWAGKAAANVQTYGNIRGEASEEAEIIGVLLPGCQADVLETEGDWSRIRSGNVEGYIHSDLLVFGEEARVHYKNVYGFQGTVTANVLNVRAQATTDSEILDQETEGQEVRILEEQDGWYKILHQGEEAYMFADYVELGGLSHEAMTWEEYQQKLAEEEAARQAAAEAEAARQAEEKAAAAAEAEAAAQAVQAETEAQATEEETSAQSVSVSGSELDLLAALIQCEAGGESRTGKVAVGAVVLNRVASGSFPNSITEVIYQSGQFTPAYSGALASVLATGARSDCYEAAQAALNGENPVGGCLYFNSGYGQGIQIGYQHFY